LRDYFIREKFDHPQVKAAIKEYTGAGRYGRILVVLQVREDEKTQFEAQAKKSAIETYYMSDIINELVGKVKPDQRDDVLRTSGHSFDQRSGSRLEVTKSSRRV